MNSKRERFCREYVIDFNATQAAIRAGYSKRTANQQGSRLLANVDVRARIDKLQAEHAERLNVTADSLTQLLRDDRDLAHRHARAGAAVSATDKLARLHGLMSDRLKIDVTADLTRLSHAELEAALDEVEREHVRLCGRPWIEEQIARFQRLLAEFDAGAFDDRAPQRVAGSLGARPRAALPAPSLEPSAPSEK